MGQASETFGKAVPDVRTRVRHDAHTRVRPCALPCRGVVRETVKHSRRGGPTD